MFADVNNSSVSLPQTVGACALGWESSKIIERAAEARLPTKHGDFRIIGYRSLVSDEEFVVLTRGAFKSGFPALARIHSQCLTGDVFGSIKCDCGQQLNAALELIAEEGCGAIIYQQQDRPRHRDHQ